MSNGNNAEPFSNFTADVTVFIDEIKEVGKQDTSISVKVAILEGDENDPSKTFADLIVYGEQAKAIIKAHQNSWPNFNNHHPWFASIRIGSMYPKTFGENGTQAVLAGRLLKFTELKIGDKAINFAEFDTQKAPVLPRGTSPMKATMQAKLIDCNTIENQVVITVINLGDKRTSAKDMTIDLTLKEAANKKIAHIVKLLSESNDIILKLSIGENLDVVTDILTAKINGMEIDFSELDKEIKENQENKESHEEEQIEMGMSIITTVLFLLIGLLIGMFALNYISTMH